MLEQLAEIRMATHVLSGHHRLLANTALAASSLSATPMTAQAQDRSWEWGWSMHPAGWMWGAWGIGMMVMMFAFWALLVAGTLLAIRWLARQGGADSHRDRALEILRERYARGEIDKQEFDARRRDLS